MTKHSHSALPDITWPSVVQLPLAVGHPDQERTASAWVARTRQLPPSRSAQPLITISTESHGPRERPGSCSAIRISPALMWARTRHYFAKYFSTSRSESTYLLTAKVRVEFREITQNPQRVCRASFKDVNLHAECRMNGIATFSKEVSVIIVLT